MDEQLRTLQGELARPWSKLPLAGVPILAHHASWSWSPGSKADKVAVGKAVQRVQIGWPVGRPLCGSLGNGLYEVRQDLSDNRTGRVLFCFSGKSEIVLLHAFIKKTQKIPQAEIDLARRRMKGGRP